MKNILLAFFILCFAGVGRSQNWTWMKGSNTVNATGVYGTKGVAAATNTPGAREGATIWSDTKGNLWLFGGTTSGWDPFADLWKYDPFAGQWTWVNGVNTRYYGGSYGTQGVSSPTNHPGARRNATGWTDNRGNLWLFGGYGCSGTDTGKLGDLWRYNISKNEWTFMKGSSTVRYKGNYGTKGVSATTNAPGSREFSHGFYYGALYLFGGDGKTPTSAGSLNDIWKYDIATNEWTWIKGSDSATSINNYGTLGIENSANTPCGRQSGAFASDGYNFYFMGGQNYPNKYYSDLWKYNALTNNWTWINGPNSSNNTSKYGIQGVYDTANTPGSRLGSALFFNKSYLFFFGGIGTLNSAGTLLYTANDLWQFELNTTKWRYIKGTKLQNQTGIYGTLGVSASTNYPGSRYNFSSCIDTFKNIWIFGGEGKASTSATGELNDLWKYTFICIEDLSITPQNNKIKIGDTATFTAKVSDPNPTYTWQSDFGQGYVTLKNYGKYSGVNTANLKIGKVELSEHKQPVRAITVSGSCIDTSNIGTIYITDTCVVTRYDTNIVKVYDTSYISVTDTLVIKTKISGTTPPGLNSIKVFPNPASTHININYGNYALMSGYTLKITNATGQSVYQTNITKQSDYIDLSTWGGNGLYYIYIIDPKSNVIETRKIVLK